ncbi:hypothetical protein M422DRAFT_24982 [Sphaerobolus stellatus SS14]|nr:hypothetical protein M422DRAFT_24982 [Sphaerobolus stellatus SS14]
MRSPATTSHTSITANVREKTKRRRDSSIILRFLRHGVKINFPWARRAKSSTSISVRTEHKLHNLNSLPDEVLQEVFLHCLPLFERCFPDPSETGFDFPNEYPELLGPHPRIINSLLGRVCRRWAHVVVNTPLLWTTIVLDTEMDNIEYIQKCLTLSRRKRLDIFIRPWSRENRRDMTSVFTFMSGHFDRTRILQAYTDPKELEALFSNGSIIRMPKAKLIEVNCPRDSVLTRNGTELPPSIGTIEADNLVYLHAFHPIVLQRFIFSSGKFYSLKFLFLDTTLRRPSESLRFIGSCPNLEDLTIYEFGGSGTWLAQSPRLPYIRYTLPNLAAFKLHGDYSEETVFFLRSLHMPSLRYLDLGTPGEAIEPSRYTNQVYYYLLQEYSKSIHGLPIDNVTSAGMSSITRHFVRLENLRMLIFRKVHIYQGFLEHLIPDIKNPGRPGPCPYLGAIYCIQVDLADQTFTKLIKTRCLSDKEYAQEIEGQSGPHKLITYYTNPRARLLRIVFIKCAFLEDGLFQDMLDLSQEYSRIIEFKYEEIEDVDE